MQNLEANGKGDKVIEVASHGTITVWTHKICLLQLLMLEMLLTVDKYYFDINKRIEEEH
jgi:hypothetical protein